MKDEQRESTSAAAPAPLSDAGRWLVLAAAFLGWTFAGVQMALTTLVMRSAMVDLLGLPERFNKQSEALPGQWSAWLVAAFLLGAAGGGLIFGWIGDRIGRSKALGLSILWSSLACGACYWVESPVQLVVLRALVGLGIGGTWPNGVALVSEVWPKASRPMLAGMMGAAANVGLGAMSAIGMKIAIRPTNWEWTMLVGAFPVVLALLVFFLVPESPRWLASRVDGGRKDDSLNRSPVAEIFCPPLLGITVVGIILGAIPLIGGWGSANWIVSWADQIGSNAEEADYSLKAAVQFWRSVTSIIGSLLGGWFASQIGRRRSYFLISLGALLTAQYLFRWMVPGEGLFMALVAILGLFNGLYFGWLPLFLPELFPTRVRSTGSGVTYNFGRILTVGAVLAGGGLMSHFGKDYAQIGTLTSFVFAIGMLAILFAPDTSGKELED